MNDELEWKVEELIKFIINEEDLTSYSSTFITECKERLLDIINEEVEVSM